MAVWSAEANTSAGAPRTICCIRMSEAPKLLMTLTPGCCCSKALPRSLKALVRLDAAETTRSVACAGAAPRANKIVLAAAMTRRENDLGMNIPDEFQGGRLGENIEQVLPKYT